MWALAYLVAFSLGALWGAWFERNGWPGFVGVLLGWGVGGAVGALVSGYVNSSRRRGVGPAIVAAVWGLSFFAGGYVAVVAGMVLAQTAKHVLALLGQRAALTIGWGLGAALGGALASAFGMAAHEAITGSSQVVSRPRPRA